jgi:pimeloyl-ACP methyl ester carboxylesterase
LKKVVVLLPGVLGSTLYIGQQKIWPSWEIATGMAVLYVVRKFKDPDFEFDVRGVLQDNDTPIVGGLKPIPGYTIIRNYFKAHGFAIVLKENGWATPSGDKYFYEFPYDWRLDLRRSAAELRAFIQNYILNQFSDAEIYLVGHSMGGLLSRTYLKFYAGTQIGNIKRQILIGTPNHGSPKAYLALKYGVGLLASKGFLRDIPRNLHKLAVDLPGIYQLLPNTRYESYFKDYGTLVYMGAGDEKSVLATYIPAKSSYVTASRYWGLNNDTLVEDALKFHDQLKDDTYIGSDQTYAIFSTEVETLNRLQTLIGKTYEINMFNGDGTVPERSAYDLLYLMNQNPPVEPEPRFTRRFTGVTHVDLIRDKRCLECLLSLIL